MTISQLRCCGRNEHEAFFDAESSAFAETQLHDPSCFISPACRVNMSEIKFSMVKMAEDNSYRGCFELVLCDDCAHPNGFDCPVFSEHSKSSY